MAPKSNGCNPPPFYKGAPDDFNAAAFHADPDPKSMCWRTFKIVSDPFVGKLGIFRVHQGTIRKDSQLLVGDVKRSLKVGHLYRLQGKDYVEVDELIPGDIGAVAKVDEIEFDCVLHDSHEEDHIHLKPLEFPEPMQGLAVETRKKADEQLVRRIAARNRGPVLQGRTPSDNQRNGHPRAW